MTKFNEGPITFEADEALAIDRLVKIDADGKITYADATDFPDGSVHDTILAAGDLAAVRPYLASGTRRLTANAAITLGATIYAADDGKVAPSGTIPVGKAVQAASANGDRIECLLLPLSLWMPAAAIQSLSGSGAVNVTAYLTKVTTAGSAAALTLANGTRPGQLKKIQFIVDSGHDGTLTPTSLSGGTTITFADVGDYAVLLWNGAAWVAIELGNDADGTSAPVLA